MFIYNCGMILDFNYYYNNYCEKFVSQISDMQVRSGFIYHNKFSKIQCRPVICFARSNSTFYTCML